RWTWRSWTRPKGPRSGPEPSLFVLLGPRRSLETELVALGVLHDDPVLPALLDLSDLRRPQRDGPLRRLSLAPPALVLRRPPTAAHVHIEMHPILRRLPLWHPLEVEPGPHALGIPDRAGRIPVLLRD